MSGDPQTLITGVVAAATEADGIAPLDEATLLSLRHDGLQGVSFTGNEDGFVLVRHGELHLVVHPEARGQGLGTALLDRVPDASSTGPLTAWSHGDHPAARALAESHGWDLVRELLVLRRPASPLPGSRPLPAGVVVRSLQPGDGGAREADDLRALLAVNAAAFAHHPEQGSLEEEGLRERMAEPWFDPAGLLLATLGGEADARVLGFHWTKRHVEGPDAGVGEVYVIGVAPDAQGIGLGRVLLEAGLRHLDAERRDVILYVEADNAPALRLYESYGFARSQTHVQYQVTP